MSSERYPAIKESLDRFVSANQTQTNYFYFAPPPNVSWKCMGNYIITYLVYVTIWPLPLSESAHNIILFRVHGVVSPRPLF